MRTIYELNIRILEKENTVPTFIEFDNSVVYEVTVAAEPVVVQLPEI